MRDCSLGRSCQITSTLSFSTAPGHLGGSCSRLCDVFHSKFKERTGLRATCSSDVSEATRAQMRATFAMPLFTRILIRGAPACVAKTAVTNGVAILHL